jgi:hypothetical protein
MIREVRSPICKPRGVLASNPGELNKVKHVPVYGPPASSSRGDQSMPGAITAALSTTISGGRDAADPDPFPPPSRPK